MSYPNFWVLKLGWVMIYFIFLQVWHRSLVISSFIGETWRGFGFASNLLTCPLVDSSTYHVTLSLIQATCKLVHSLTCPLTMLLCLLFSLSTSNWFTRLLVDLSTCLLFNKKTSQPCIFNKFCYICKLFNTYVSHVCWDYRYFILWV